MKERRSSWVRLLLILFVSLRSNDAFPVVTNRIRGQTSSTKQFAPLLSSASNIDVRFDGDPIETSFHVSERVDSRNAIRHCELYSKKLWYSRFMQFFPYWWPPFLRPKPCAKAGVRNYLTPASGYMDDVIRGLFLFGNETSANNPTASIGILVYMWVQPSLRGSHRIGDYLLLRCVQTLRRLRATHMLLVHDDNGSGKLINYYQQRGFYPIFANLDKGMIGQL